MVTLELIRDFVNTLDIEESSDALADPSALVSWFNERGLLAVRSRVRGTDVRAAQELREALRALLLVNNGCAAEVNAAGKALERAARAARIELRFADGAAQLVPVAAGVAGALGRIVAGVQAAMADGSWSRLKACRAGDCQWAFVDTAKNQSRAWCSMKVCGNREKARAFRERQRSGAAEG